MSSSLNSTKMACSDYIKTALIVYKISKAKRSNMMDIQFDE